MNAREPQETYEEELLATAMTPADSNTIIIQLSFT